MVTKKRENGKALTLKLKGEEREQQKTNKSRA